MAFVQRKSRFLKVIISVCKIWFDHTHATPPPKTRYHQGLALLLYWDEQPHAVASDPNNDWNWAEELHRKPEWREQLVADLDGRPIGFV